MVSEPMRLSASAVLITLTPHSSLSLFTPKPVLGLAVACADRVQREW